MYVIERRDPNTPAVRRTLKIQSLVVMTFWVTTYHTTRVQEEIRRTRVVRRPGLYPLFFNWNVMTCWKLFITNWKIIRANPIQGNG